MFSWAISRLIITHSQDIHSKQYIHTVTNFGSADIMKLNACFFFSVAYLIALVESAYTADDIALGFVITKDQDSYDFAQREGWVCSAKDMDKITQALRKAVFKTQGRQLRTTEGRQLPINSWTCQNICKWYDPSNRSLCYAITPACWRRALKDSAEAVNEEQHAFDLENGGRILGDLVPENMQEECDTMKKLALDAYNSKKIGGLSDECRDSIVFETAMAHVYEVSFTIFCVV